MLPMPPTINSYWADRIIQKGARAFGARYVTHEGKHYMAQMEERVTDLRMRYHSEAMLAMMMVVCFRDARRNDLDNRVKSFQDSLKQAKVYMDDSQIELLQVIKGPNIQEGRVLLFLSEIRIDYDRLLADALSVKYISGGYLPAPAAETPQQSGDLFQDEASEASVRRSARRVPARRRSQPPG